MHCDPATLSNAFGTDCPSRATRKPAPFSAASWASVRPNELATKMNLHD